MTHSSETRLSFAEHGGMRGAADRCQRIGACRKTGSGVMCPSYMATREEEHSTRGRANALVRALSEPDPRAALGVVLAAAIIVVQGILAAPVLQFVPNSLAAAP